MTASKVVTSHAIARVCIRYMLCALFCFSYCSQTFAATADIFRTPEYQAMNSLDAVKAAQAYALGFTGKGVRVGVIDSGARPSHVEFINKAYYPAYYYADVSQQKQDHGVHVTGTIAASKNNTGMHGLAFDADLVSLAAIEGKPLGDQDPVVQAISTLRQYPEVRIVNNSWGMAWETGNLAFYDQWTEQNEEEYLEVGEAIAQVVKEQDVLFVFSAGNSGLPSPTMSAGTPSYLMGTQLLADYQKIGITDIPAENPALGAMLQNNMISVGAYDPIAMNTWGTKSLAFVAPFSNMGDGASDYTIFAPGVDIYSSVNTNDTAYRLMPGTSMAAPHVSGAAALVSQAFPYMGGKQLADVILSTATKLEQGDVSKFLILARNNNIQQPHIITWDANLDASDFEGHEEELKRIYYASTGNSPDLDDKNKWYYSLFLDTVEEILANKTTSDSFHLMSSADYMSLFGVGMLDVFKAVRGPGYFNAKRLSAADKSGSFEFAGSEYYAMYAVDTQGYDSIWSNNIGEVRATSGDLAGLGVGLRKSGNGLLYLTGNNSYTGPTEIRGGGISLGMAGYGSGAGIAGDVYVRDAGMFTGAGTIKGNLTSSGLLVPGFMSGPVGQELHVDGSITNTGGMRLIVGQGGRSNKLSAGGDIYLTDSRWLEFAGKDGEAIEPFADYLNVVSTSGGTIHYPANIPDRIDFSAFLTFEILHTPTSLSLRGRTLPLDGLANVPGRTQSVARALQHMFDALEGDLRQNQLDFLFGRTREGFLNDAAALRGDLQATTLTSLPLDGVLNRLVSTNPLGSQKSMRAAQPPASFPTASGPNASGEEQNTSFWLRPVAGYSRVDGQSSIGQSDTGTHMRGLVLGGQRDLDDVYVGALAAIADGDVRQGSAKANITDVRAGVYGGWKPGGLSLGAVITGGTQHYKTQRSVPVEGGSSPVNSSFDGFSFGLGLEASYNLLHGRSSRLSFSPYVAFDLDYTWQDGRKESGNDVFALHIESEDLWRASLKPGLKVDYMPLDWLNLSASAGYKRRIGKQQPTLDVGFKADSSYRFEAVGTKEGRDFVTYSVGAEAALPKNVSVAARFFGENSNKSHSYSGFINLRYNF